MQTLKNKIGRILAAIVCTVVTFALSTGQVMAQATAQGTLEDAADDLVTSGTAVGVAALAIFAAMLIFGVVKRFFMTAK